MISFLHLLTRIWTYILQLRQGTEIPVVESEVVVQQPIVIDPPLDFHGRIPSLDVQQFAEVYSSDKSMLRSYTYGGSVNDFIQAIDRLADAVNADQFFDHDKLMETRVYSFVRDIFVDPRQGWVSPVPAAARLKTAALRLASGYKLRMLHPELGVHTYQNNITALFVLQDLEDIFKLVDNGYQTHRDSRSGADHSRQAG